MGAMYSNSDAARVAGAEKLKRTESYRSPWRRDYARLIHCPSFRRLQGKTQVFPGHESDFFRNRLTHSLEVAQIAKSIATRLNATTAEFKEHKLRPEIVEFAGLAHDLGHPPFGHTGEEALDRCMKDEGGFEGNAQTLRIIGRLEKKSTLRLVNDEFVAFDGHEDLRCGLNLTFRSLASILKYDYVIPERDRDRKLPGDVNKGYYEEESELVSKIKNHVLGTDDYTLSLGKFKTIECSIMDIADDIAYSTYDLEDNFKAGFLSPVGLFSLDDKIYDAVATKIIERVQDQYQDKPTENIDRSFVVGELYRIFNDILFSGDEFKDAGKLPPRVLKALVSSEVEKTSIKYASNGYLRTRLTSELVQKFLNAIEVVPNKSFPQLIKKYYLLCNNKIAGNASCSV
jgi:dGTPase